MHGYAGTARSARLCITTATQFISWLADWLHLRISLPDPTWTICGWWGSSLQSRARFGGAALNSQNICGCETAKRLLIGSSCMLSHCSHNSIVLGWLGCGLPPHFGWVAAFDGFLPEIMQCLCKQFPADASSPSFLYTRLRFLGLLIPTLSGAMSFISTF